jgi:hypothetical protein
MTTLAQVQGKKAMQLCWYCYSIEAAAFVSRANMHTCERFISNRLSRIRHAGLLIRYNVRSMKDYYVILL